MSIGVVLRVIMRQTSTRFCAEMGKEVKPEVKLKAHSKSNCFWSGVRSEAQAPRWNKNCFCSEVNPRKESEKHFVSYWGTWISEARKKGLKKPFFEVNLGSHLHPPLIHPLHWTSKQHSVVVSMCFDRFKPSQADLPPVELVPNNKVIYHWRTVLANDPADVDKRLMFRVSPHAEDDEKHPNGENSFEHGRIRTSRTPL